MEAERKIISLSEYRERHRSRRNFLRYSATGIASILIGTGTVALFAKESEKSQTRLEPSLLFLGTVEIDDNFHIQKNRPSIIKRTVGPRIDFKSIQEVNGVKVGADNSFSLETLPIIEGRGPNAINPGFWTWIRATVQTNPDISEQKILYIFIPFQNPEDAQKVRKIISRDKTTYHIRYGGEVVKIRREDVGRILRK